MKARSKKQVASEAAFDEREGVFISTSCSLALVGNAAETQVDLRMLDAAGLPIVSGQMTPEQAKTLAAALHQAAIQAGWLPGANQR